MMRHQLLTSVFLIATFGAPVAIADLIDMTTYTINFTGANAPTAGSFTFDADTQIFSSFSVIWDAHTYDLTSSANAPTINGGGPPCIAGQTGGAATYTLISGSCGPPLPLQFIGWSAVDLPSGGDSFSFAFDFQHFPAIGISVDGTVTFPADAGEPLLGASGGWTIAPVPEPSALSLLLMGLVSLAFMARKRTGEPAPHI
jgi:hypothetical protein